MFRDFVGNRDPSSRQPEYNDVIAVRICLELFRKQTPRFGSVCKGSFHAAHRAGRESPSFNVSRLEGAPGVFKSACFAEGQAGQWLEALKPLLALASRISVWPRRRRREIEAFCLQLVLNFLNGAIELLICAFEFFPGIIIDDDIRINSVT